MSDTKIKARLYIDGNFTVHIHKYLVKAFNKTIDWKSFQEYIKDKISKEEGKICTLESHFFVGTGLESTDKDRDYLFNSMEHENIIKHATPLKKKVTGGLKEDAVDTNLVFYATQDYYKREEYDYLVLLAGDSDFVPLVKGLAAEAVKTFVIYMDFVDNELGKTQTAQALLDETEMRENINSLLLERVDEKIKSIFIDHTTGENKAVVEVTTEASKVIQKKTSAKIEAKPTEKKEVVDVKKKQVKQNTPTKIPFTKEQLEKAIIKTQKSKTDSRNEFVLVAQVGENLKGVIKQKLHGKFFNMINKNFHDDFEYDLSETSSPKIRLKRNWDPVGDSAMDD